MPIKDKNKCLIKFRKKPYNNLKEFLKDIFYRDKKNKLYIHAYELLRLVYDRKELGLKAKNWNEHIKNIFNAEPLDKNEEEILKKIYKRFYSQEIKRGKKPYIKLLKRAKKGEIILSDIQRKILEKSVKWNSFVSAYYSIMNKLTTIGLIEKKEGRYYKSRAIFEQFKRVENLMSEFEVSIRS